MVTIIECSECGGTTDTFWGAECVAYEGTYHHGDCRHDCSECRAAAAQDAEAGE